MVEIQIQIQKIHFLYEKSQKLFSSSKVHNGHQTLNVTKTKMSPKLNRH